MKAILDEPEFDEPYEVSLMFETLSSRTEKGSIQTVSRQTVPKGLVRMTRNRSEEDMRSRFVEAILETADSVLVPYRCFGSVFSNVSGAITVEDFEYMYRPGGHAIFWDGEGSYRTEAIVSVNGTTFSIDSGVDTSGYSQVFPAFVGRRNESPISSPNVRSSVETAVYSEF